VVRYLVGEAGIRQIIDNGTGIPTVGNVHEVAQQIDSGVRVAYVDSDPIVLTHARALLTSTGEGATAYVHADIRDTGEVLARATETLDFSRPVAVMALMILQYVPDEDDPWGIVARLVDALAPGSYLTISDTVRDIDTGRVTEGTARLNERMGPTPAYPAFLAGVRAVLLEVGAGRAGRCPSARMARPGVGVPDPVLCGDGPQAALWLSDAPGRLGT
jgi:hypothetical protein